MTLPLYRVPGVVERRPMWRALDAYFYWSEDITAEHCILASEFGLLDSRHLHGSSGRLELV
jgi:hypothetical protein